MGRKFNLEDFLWDRGNKDKNWIKHRVANKEAEEAFFDEKKKTFKDILHSQKEERYRILGKTNKKRLLLVVFTKRSGKIRIISARDSNKREAMLYEEKTDFT